MPLPESEYLSPIWKDGIFDGRVAFVTGGAGTICSAQTRALVRLGANACIVGRNVAKTEAAARDIATARPGAKVIGIGECDVRSFDSIKKAVDRCVKELGGIDFVIAGAAGNFLAPIDGISPNGFKSVMDIDVLGTFNTVKAVLPHLVHSAQSSPNPRPDPSAGGRMIFVSATFHYTGVPFQAHVAAAKSAVDSLMASVALEYGPRGVACNVISPGAIDNTEGMRRLMVGEKSRMEKAIPLGRMGHVRDIADATVYLFSAAGAYHNGLVMPVDGGQWRRQGSAFEPEGMQYPDHILAFDPSSKL